jgi:hypothetical protein
MLSPNLKALPFAGVPLAHLKAGMYNGIQLKTRELPAEAKKERKR